MANAYADDHDPERAWQAIIRAAREFLQRLWPRQQQEFEACKISRDDAYRQLRQLGRCLPEPVLSVHGDEMQLVLPFMDLNSLLRAQVLIETVQYMVDSDKQAQQQAAKDDRARQAAE